ncbi:MULTISPECIES: hypothetical protein [Clostridia]|uniref:hypothetical protein n=1 Tax=Clostridia TaxID=186801 RepID=UPI0011DD9730|nr:MULTISPECIES: hypothetical protein [Clostridia]
MMNFTVNIQNKFTQNAGESNLENYNFSIVQHSVPYDSVTEDRENATPIKKKGGPGIGQILKDIKRSGRRDYISELKMKL